MTTGAARTEWELWCAEREQFLRAVPGSLALVANQPLGDEPEPVDLVEGVAAWFVPGEAGVRLRIDAGVSAQVAGEPVSGEAVLPRLGPGGPFLRVGQFWVDAFSLEGAAYELRIYDEDAAALANFAGIECYDYDPDLVRPARFTGYDEVAAVPWEFTKQVDTGRPKSVPGEIAIDLAGGPATILAFKDGPELVLVFADGTTGAESYAPGRFLRIPLPEGDADLQVDFNRAFIPPCGFSDFYSCPIPPAQNRLTVPIRAGERRAAWHAPRPGHGED